MSGFSGVTISSPRSIPPIRSPGLVCVPDGEGLVSLLGVVSLSVAVDSGLVEGLEDGEVLGLGLGLVLGLALGEALGLGEGLALGF